MIAILHNRVLFILLKYFIKKSNADCYFIIAKSMIILSGSKTRYVRIKTVQKYCFYSTRSRENLRMQLSDGHSEINESFHVSRRSEIVVRSHRSAVSCYIILYK